MTLRENFLAVLNYRPRTHLPVVRFGHWPQTLQRWHREGHITEEELLNYGDGNRYDMQIAKRQGFDFPVWNNAFGGVTGLLPQFTEEVVETLPDGTRKKRNIEGAIVLEKDDAYSIPPEVAHTLVDRASFEKHFRWRLQYSEERINVQRLGEYLRNPTPEYPVMGWGGSFYGKLRNWMGLEGISYLAVDDPQLYDELIDTVGNINYLATKRVFELGFRPDVLAFWEDICCKSGPLISPKVFRQKIAPHYKRVCDMAKGYGVSLFYVDCDGVVDALLPIWLESGVNVMFPVEVGTWGGSIAPWRKQYGREVRGIGGVNKHVLAGDRAAIDAEIERIRPLVDLGGYLPCLDHHITPVVPWENVQYYCDRMRKVFG
jgi:hypothetical protein